MHSCCIATLVSGFKFCLMPIVKRVAEIASFAANNLCQCDMFQ